MSKRMTHLLEEFAEAAQHAHGLVGAGRVARSSKKIARQPVNAANCRRLVADMTETPAAHNPGTPRHPIPPADACLRRWPGHMLSPHLPPSPAGEAQPQRQPPPARRHHPSPSTSWVVRACPPTAFLPLRRRRTTACPSSTRACGGSSRPHRARSVGRPRKAGRRQTKSHAPAQALGSIDRVPQPPEAPSPVSAQAPNRHLPSEAPATACLTDTSAPGALGECLPGGLPYSTVRSFSASAFRAGPQKLGGTGPGPSFGGPCGSQLRKSSRSGATVIANPGTAYRH